MVPLRLSLKNFMCYRDNAPELDLESIHVACLCGDNGHGKTALLDAMTWALWGKARASTQEELVHQGQQDMAVELEFKARGQRYRVSRRHSRSERSRQGTTMLELQVTSENGSQAITGNSIRETEENIRRILHLDYDTFVNTAFLVQGKADRFSRSTPASRKATLAEVLDLEYFQRIEALARDKGRGREAELREIEVAIAAHREHMGDRADLRERLATADATLEELAPLVEAQVAHTEDLQKAFGSLSSQRSELEAIERRLGSAQDVTAGLAQQVETHEANIHDQETVLEQQDAVQEGFSQLESARAGLERLDRALSAKSELDGRRSRLEQEIAIQGERLAGRAQTLRDQIERDLKPSAGRLDHLESELGGTATEQARLDDLERNIQAGRDELQQLSARSTFLGETNKALMEQMEETRRKFEILGDEEAECPVCRQPLGPEGREHLTAEYEVQGLEAKQEYQRNANEAKGLELARFKRTAKASDQENELSAGRRQLQSRLAELDRDIGESKRATEELGPATAELGRFDGQITAGTFAQDERRDLGQVAAELARLGYYAADHDRVREEVRSLEVYADRHRALMEATRALPQEREALATVRQMLDARRQQAAEDEDRRSALTQELKALPDLEGQLAQARSSLNQARDNQGKAQVEHGVLQSQLRTLAEMEAEVRVHEQARRRVERDKNIYDELAAAFGRNGIQALIIETAMPQLQEDTNEILGRLTENRLFLKLELREGRRDSRTGLPSEALEIMISDEVGTRSYETFSGGEAFRIDFALRIALSKLLARRSGAPLPILFIDEGFGTQDSEGQERLKEAIHSIQDDFEKIIVITHVEQVKESFPVRIEVTKTEMGSTFAVV